MNPDNPVTRLRAQLSTSSQMMTRQMLSKKSGIPLGSIAAIETDVYRLTYDNALRLAFASGASAESLLRGDHPLLDMAGDQLGPKSIERLQDQWTDDDRRQDEILLSLFLKAASRKKAALKVSMSFRIWMKETSLVFGLDEAVFEELFSAPPELDLALVPDWVFPQDMADERRAKRDQEKARRQKFLKEAIAMREKSLTLSKSLTRRAGSSKKTA